MVTHAGREVSRGQVASGDAEGPNGNEGGTPVSLEGVMAQKSKQQLELPFLATGASREPQRSEQTPTAAIGNERPGTRALMQEVVSHRNIERAAKRVKSNGGAPGTDGMTVNELPGWLREHWPVSRTEMYLPGCMGIQKAESDPPETAHVDAPNASVDAPPYISVPPDEPDNDAQPRWDWSS